MENLELLKDLTQRLEQAGIPYMVTGSMALTFYSIPRMTRDIDLVVAIEPRDADGIVELLEKDYYVSDEAVAEAIAHRASFNVIHYEGVAKADLMVRRDTEYRRTEFERRRQLPLGDAIAWVVAPEDLILSKLDWARDSRSEHQLADVRNLLRSDLPLDREYLELWANRLGLSDLLQEQMA